MPFTVYDNSPEMELPHELKNRTSTNDGADSPDTAMICDSGDADSSQFSMSPREQHDQESEMCLRMFESWTQTRQTEFVEQLITRMSFHQHEHLYSILMPMLQRDFITVLPGKWDGGWGDRKKGGCGWERLGGGWQRVGGGGGEGKGSWGGEEWRAGR